MKFKLVFKRNRHYFVYKIEQSTLQNEINLIKARYIFVLKVRQTIKNVLVIQVWPLFLEAMEGYK